MIYSIPTSSKERFDEFHTERQLLREELTSKGVQTRQIQIIFDKAEQKAAQRISGQTTHNDRIKVSVVRNHFTSQLDWHKIVKAESYMFSAKDNNLGKDTAQAIFGKKLEPPQMVFKNVPNLGNIFSATNKKVHRDRERLVQQSADPSDIAFYRKRSILQPADMEEEKSLRRRQTEELELAERVINQAQAERAHEQSRSDCAVDRAERTRLAEKGLDSAKKRFKKKACA